MNLESMIEVLQAAKAGKKIQRAGYGMAWQDFNGLEPTADWDFYRFIFRVKPEPREWVVPEKVLYHYDKGPLIKVREVLE